MINGNGGREICSLKMIHMAGGGILKVAGYYKHYDIARGKRRITK